MDETSPPEGENTQDYLPEVPEPPAPPVDVPEPPAPPVEAGAGAPTPVAKPKTDVAFLILGLATPVALTAALNFTLLSADVAPGLEFLAPLLIAGLFLGGLLMVLKGRSDGNVRLRSYGKGVMWAYAIIPLGVLLLTGYCLIGGLPG